MLKKTLEKWALDAVSLSGLPGLLAPAWGGQGVIFCLHHVLPGGGLQRGFAPNGNLEITPDFLDDIIRCVVSKGYELVSLDEALGLMKQPHRGRFAVFTLDDGYKDNLYHAMPVFKRHHCPFTVYVSPRISDGTCELWWRGLEAIIGGAQSLDMMVGDFRFQAVIADDAAKWRAWRVLAPHVQNMPEYAQREWIRKQASMHGVDIDAYCRSVAMTWNEIREMAASPLATIGAHTLNHYNLLRLPEADMRREIVESGKRIEAELGRSVRHFAYPYGNKDAAGPREFRAAKDAGYASAVVTRLGSIVPEHAHHVHALPRLMVSGKYQKRRYINALVSGMPSRLSNGLRALNVG
jgi:peptidoglycan/xylan/chitin deacetylase (PgdA/CDA1 family)